MQHDAVTLEELGTVYVDAPARARNAFADGRFFMVSQQRLRDIARQVRSAQALRLLLDMLCRLEYDARNRIRITQTEIAQALGMRQQNAALALQRLEEAGVVLRERRGQYWLNPEVAWCGRFDQHQSAIDRYHALQMWRCAGVPDDARLIIWEQWETRA